MIFIQITKKSPPPLTSVRGEKLVTYAVPPYFATPLHVASLVYMLNVHEANELTTNNGSTHLFRSAT